MQDNLLTFLAPLHTTQKQIFHEILPWSGQAPAYFWTSLLLSFARGKRQRNMCMCLEKKVKAVIQEASAGLSLFVTSSTTVSREGEATPPLCRNLVLCAKKAAGVGHWLLNTEKRHSLCSGNMQTKRDVVCTLWSQPLNIQKFLWWKAANPAAEKSACVGLQQELSQGYPREAARLNKDHKPATDPHGKNGILSNSQEWAPCL